MKNTETSKNVCRRFVLYNDFLPPTCKRHNWPFFAFGYYDGFSTGKNLFDDSDEQSFMQLWNDSRMETRKLDEMAMSQTIYGFRDEGQETASKDELFWNEKQEGERYPFIFFVMIQFEAQGRKRLPELYAQKEEVENSYTKDGRYKAILYLTLENSDLLFIVRSRDYESGARVIDQFHRKKPFYQMGETVWNVRYSFTVAAIDKQFLTDPDKLLNDQNKIDHVYIYVTERYGGSIDDYFSELKRHLPKTVKIRKESILGYNDELIILFGITWDELLGLYKIETGLLNHTNMFYQKYLSGLTSIIGLGQDNTEVQEKKIDRETDPKENRKPAGESDKETDNEIDKKNQFGVWAKKHIQELEEINQTHASLHQNMMQSLYHLVNSFSRFDNSPVRENLFFPASYSICQMILMLKEMLRKDNQYTNKLTCYGDYQRFLSGLNMYAQNWVRSDRQFTQSLDFNIRIYNLPVVLNAFYNAFMFYVKESLNDPGDSDQHHVYEFLTCPGAAPDMVVDELFIGQSENSRFCLINIPENQTYNPELMLIMLCHEVAHFVGAYVRNRPFRFRYLSEAFCRMVTFYYRYQLEDLYDPSVNEYWNEFERKLVEDVREGEGYYTEGYLKHKFSKSAGQSDQDYEAEIRKVLQRKNATRYHSWSVHEYLLDSMIGIIREKKDQYFAARENMEYFSAYKQCMDKEAAEKRKKEFQEQIHCCSMELIQLRPGARNLPNLNNMMTSLMGLFKEGFSDVIGIMLLHLTCTQYLKAFIQNIDDQGKPDILAAQYFNETLIRVGLVCSAMIQTKTGENAGYSWKGSDLDIDTGDTAVNEAGKKVKLFIFRYLKNGEKLQKNEVQVNVVTNYLLDQSLLKVVKRYLFECRVRLTESLENENRENSRKKAMEMFRLIREDSVSNVMLGLHSFVDEYRNEIYAKMEQLSSD